MTITQTAEFRETLRSMLEKYVKEEELEELVVNITSAAKIAFSAEMGNLRRRGALVALTEGLNKSEAIRSRLDERFRMNYPWQTKQGKDTLEFLMTTPECETVDSFADWWWSDPWRREHKGSPSLMEIVTFWPQAFKTPVYSMQPARKVFRAEEDTL